MRFTLTPPPFELKGFIRWVYDTFRRLIENVPDNQPRWDDLRFPAQAIRAGSVSPPTEDTATGCWLFNGNVTEQQLWLVCQLPHGWAENSELRPHVHWSRVTTAATATAAVRWGLEYKWWPIGEVIDASWTTLTASTVAADIADTLAADQHLITPLGTIDGAGKQISDCLVMRIYRNPAHADDTYATLARLIEFDIHALFDQPGSTLQWIKQ